MTSIIPTCFGTGVPSSGTKLTMTYLLWFVFYCILLSAIFFINILNQTQSAYDCLATPMLAKCPAQMIIQKFATSPLSLSTSLFQPLPHLHATLNLQERNPNLYHYAYGGKKGFDWRRLAVQPESRNNLVRRCGGRASN
jgi:hypothetical protein